jgi:hypothetical protein
VLYRSTDEDEKAVAQNRLEFVISQSVELMYFVAGQLRGHPPECRDFYFLKDAMADYFDLINEVSNFDGINDTTYDLAVFSRLFEVGDIKAWFGRNEHFLRRLLSDNEPSADHQGRGMQQAFAGFD